MNLWGTHNFTKVTFCIFYFRSTTSQSLRFQKLLSFSTLDLIPSVVLLTNTISAKMYHETSSWICLISLSITNAKRQEINVDPLVMPMMIGIGFCVLSNCSHASYCSIYISLITSLCLHDGYFLKPTQCFLNQWKPYVDFLFPLLSVYLYYSLR